MAQSTCDVSKGACPFSWADATEDGDEVILREVLVMPSCVLRDCLFLVLALEEVMSGSSSGYRASESCLTCLSMTALGARFRVVLMADRRFPAASAARSAALWGEACPTLDRSCSCRGKRDANEYSSLCGV